MEITDDAVVINQELAKMILKLSNGLKALCFRVEALEHQTMNRGCGPSTTDGSDKKLCPGLVTL